MVRRMIIISLFWAIFLNSALATTFYVSNSGSNDSSGLSEQAAWQTCGYMMTQISGGDKVLFMGGTYAEQNTGNYGESTTLFLPNGISGTYGNHTTFKCAPGYNMPIFTGYGANGYNVSCSTHAISLNYDGADHITFDSLIIKWAIQGLEIWGPSDSIFVKNSVVCSTGNGFLGMNNAGIVFLDSNDPHNYVLIEGCTLFHNREVPGVTSVNSAGILAYNLNYSTITNNVVYDQPTSHGAIFLKGINSYNEISHNTVYNSTVGIQLYYDSPYNTIHHNVVYNESEANGWGIDVHGTYKVGEENHYSKVYNNTVFNVTNGIGWNAGSSEVLQMDSSQFWNNISITTTYSLAQSVYANVENYYIDYNCYYTGNSVVARWDGVSYSLAGLQESIYCDTNSVDSYPIFADPTNHDFHLTESSPVAVREGGRGGIYETYMGAFPFGPRRINQNITKDSTSTTVTITDNLSGGIIPYDSLILHWSQTRANVLNLTARDSKITDAPNPCIFYKSSLSPNTKYYFRILAYDAGSIGDTSAIDSVTTTLYDYISQVIIKSSTDTSAALIDYLSGGTDPYDSLILHWSQVRADVVNLAARDTWVTSVDNPYVFSKTSLDSNATYYYRILAYDTGAVGDTSEIDSVVTSVTSNWDIISVGVPIAVSGTYPGYSTAVINDSVVNPYGGTGSTWASDDSPTLPHWVEFDFGDTVLVAGMIVYWAWNNNNPSWMCSQQYRIQYWDEGGTFVDIETVNNSVADSVTVTWFDTTITTRRIRYYQNANMGPPTYPSIVWLTELEIYGEAGIPPPEPIGTVILSDSSAMVFANPVNVQMPLFYEFALDIDSTYPNPRIEPPLIVDTVISTTFDGLYSQYTYYWKCRAIASDLSDTSSWSWSEAFNTYSTDPQAYSYVYPDSNEEVTSRYIDFRIIFDSSPNIVFIEIDTNPDFSTSFDIAITNISQDTARWEPTSHQDSINIGNILRSNGLYYWRASPDGIYWITFPFILKLDVHAYPVPFRKSDGHSRITFTNLPENSTISIASVSGTIVFTKAGAGPGDWIWDVKNDKGGDLASGVYLYSVESKGGTSQGKIVIIR